MVNRFILTLTINHNILQSVSENISIKQARELFIQKQLLTETKLPKGKAGTYAVINQLGYVQIDTISVIDRSHHIVLFTRNPDYKHNHLHELQANDNKIFEYWAHAASFVPMKDYRYYLPRMQRKHVYGSWISNWIKKNRKVLKIVRKRIEKEGALSASDFEDEPNRKRGPWWDWKPAKMALEILFWQGILMVKERRSFQRVYDLTERILPKDLDVTKPTDKEEKQFFIRRALQAMGIANEYDIRNYISIKKNLSPYLKSLKRAGEIQEVEIEGIKNHYYILTEDLMRSDKNKVDFGNAVHFLSPFDNLIIIRNRTKALFDFDYTLECYVPKHKRKYGYFSLPILWRGELIGLIDSKADRANKTFLVQNLHLHDNRINYKQLGPSFAEALHNFAYFHKCPRVQFNKNAPKKILKYLKEITTNYTNLANDTNKRFF